MTPSRHRNLSLLCTIRVSTLTHLLNFTKLAMPTEIKDKSGGAAAAAAAAIRWSVLEFVPNTTEPVPPLGVVKLIVDQPPSAG